MVTILNFIIGVRQSFDQLPKRFWRSLAALLRLGLCLLVLSFILATFDRLVGVSHHTAIQRLLYGVWIVSVAVFAWRAYVGLWKEADWWGEEHDRRGW